MKLIVGNTGLLGTTLGDTIHFDYKFNSRNLSDMLSLDIDYKNTDLYLCCLPATKWLINQNPQTDLDNIFNILSILTKKEYRTVVLYSTIDVYSGHPLEINEDYNIEIGAPNYGNNRLLFEKLVTSTLIYNKLVVLRLPALFGKHIKKNILFDLLNDNEIDKINYNSKYQWYNLDNLHADTDHCINLINNGKLIVNLFSEPVNTSDILTMFKVDKTQVTVNVPEVVYNYKTNTNETGYIRTAGDTLLEIQEFVKNRRINNIRVAVCLFGEPRTILSKVPDWKKFNSKISIDMHLALYTNDDIYDTLSILKSELPVKSCYVTDNNLEYFNLKKYKAKKPIHLYGVDNKATFPRITSQAYIRQRAISLVDFEDYDIILLCRSDYSKFNISLTDIINVVEDNNLLIVNSGTHTHPGGGSGCTKCTVDTKCKLDYHANDICDYWCMGSPQVMKQWKHFYDDILENYYSIQETAKDPTTHNTVKYVHDEKNNEVTLIPPISELILIENDIHCYYPEKLMRVFFKQNKIVGATPDLSLWEG